MIKYLLAAYILFVNMNLPIARRYDLCIILYIKL